MNKRAGIEVHKYNGCVKCNKHIWDETDKGSICTNCGGHRYDTQGNPIEQVVHFPVKSRLEALLRDSIYFQEAVEYEKYRHYPREKYKGMMADVFSTLHDGKRWRTNWNQTPSC